MHKRIQELAEQAGMYVDLNGKPWPKWMSAEECELAYKKFALLLMREIAMVQITHQAGMDLENKKMDDPAKELSYAVIEHFGVGK